MADIEWHPHYPIINAIIFICFFYVLSLLILQLFAVNWYNAKYRKQTLKINSTHSICVYGVYITSLLCSTQCILMHISYLFDPLYCVVGAPICTAIYGASRCFLYGVWLERAKVLQSGYLAFVPDIILQKLLPFYIGSYWFIQIIIISVFFRGRLGTDSDPIQSAGHITSCHFDEWVEWVPIIATVADGFNALFFLGLFLFPIFKSINAFKDNPEKTRKFRIVVRRNVIFTTICSISSMFTLVILSDPKTLVPLFVEYIFLITNIDMVINTTFLFGTFTPNRTATAAVYRKCTRSIKRVTGSMTRTADQHHDESINTAGTTVETGTYGIKAVQMHGQGLTPLSVDTCSQSNVLSGHFPQISDGSPGVSPTPTDTEAAAFP